MPDPNIPAAAQLVAGGSISALMLAFFARFTWRKFAEEGAAAKRAGGETDIIEQLRREVDRLANLNERLSNRIGELQQEIVELRTENIELKSDLKSLRLQLRTMRTGGVADGV